MHGPICSRWIFSRHIDSINREIQTTCHYLFSFIPFLCLLLKTMDSSFPSRESIQEQRRALAEDTVSYAIYLPSSLSTSSTTTITTTTTTTTDPNSQIQDQQQHVTVLESAQVARTLMNSIVAELSKDYIWHKDAFSLTIASDQGKGSAPN